LNWGKTALNNLHKLRKTIKITLTLMLKTIDVRGSKVGFKDPV